MKSIAPNRSLNGSDYMTPKCKSNRIDCTQVLVEKDRLHPIASELGSILPDSESNKIDYTQVFVK